MCNLKLQSTENSPMSDWENKISPNFDLEMKFISMFPIMKFFLQKKNYDEKGKKSRFALQLDMSNI